MPAPKNPLTAVFLNILFPGLGMAYLGRWGYALAYLVWTPLRLAAGIAVISVIPFHSFIGEWSIIVQIILACAWWGIVMYDTCTTPYKMAVAHNQKIAASAGG